MKFDTKYERKFDSGEDISPESKTEQAGYIPPQVQIERMILSGAALNNYRRELYDFGSEDEIDDTVSVPVRDLNFDPAEATQLANQVSQSLINQQIAAQNRAALENSAKNLAAEAAKGGENND